MNRKVVKNVGIINPITTCDAISCLAMTLRGGQKCYPRLSFKSNSRLIKMFVFPGTSQRSAEEKKDVDRLAKCWPWWLQMILFYGLNQATVAIMLYSGFFKTYFVAGWSTNMKPKFYIKILPMEVFSLKFRLGSPPFYIWFHSFGCIFPRSVSVS